MTVSTVQIDGTENKVIKYEHKFHKTFDDLKPKTSRMPIISKTPLFTKGVSKAYMRYTPPPEKAHKYIKFTPVLNSSQESNEFIESPVKQKKSNYDTMKKIEGKMKEYIDFQGNVLKFSNVKNKH